MNQDVTNDQVKPIKVWVYQNKALRDTEHAVINIGHWMEAAVKLPQGSKSKQN